MGAKDRVAELWRRTRPMLVESPKTVIVLGVELEAPNATKSSDRDPAFELKDLQYFAPETLVAAIAQHDAGHAEGLARRLGQSPQGAVAVVADKPVAYVLWRPGSNDPTATIHPDLVWLGLAPRADELYVYDYYVVPESRGVGSAFVRAVQRQHLKRGYVRAFGYVHADNRAALWLYRTTGWKEWGRLDEQRFLRRLILIQNRLYWAGRHGRTLITGLADSQQ